MVESGAVVVVHGFVADASETNVAGDTTSRFGAESTSGAGGGSVGVAGSVSINIVNVDTAAAIRSGASVDAGLGDASLSAASNSISTVKAFPGGATSGTDFGLGISFALSIVNDTTFAGIEDTGLLTNAHDLTLHANGQHAMTTQAQTGATGGGVTVVPSISIAISNVTSKADIGAGTLLTLTGSLDAKAELTASATTTRVGLGGRRDGGDRCGAGADAGDAHGRVDDAARPDGGWLGELPGARRLGFRVGRVGFGCWCAGSGRGWFAGLRRCGQPGLARARLCGLDRRPGSRLRRCGLDAERLDLERRRERRGCGRDQHLQQLLARLHPDRNPPDRRRPADA